MELSANQRRVLEAIRVYWEEHRYGPAIRDLMRMCGFTSPRSISFHLNKLAGLGLVECGSHARSIRLREPKSPQGAESLVQVPVLGEVPAGAGLAQSQLALGELEVPSGLAGGVHPSSFALRVEGDSMVDAGIYDGDFVVVEQRTAKDGDIVVALVDGKSTVKRLVKRRGGYSLKAENAKYPLMLPMEELSVQGVVSAVCRKL